MSAFAYDAADLRAAGRHADDAAAAAGRALAALGADTLGTPFGSVAASASLHASVGRAHHAHARAAQQAASGFAAQAGRARGAAALGDANTVRTVALARTGPR